MNIVRIIISFHALRGRNCLVHIENPEIEILGEAETAMSCFILCFLWVWILPCNSLTGSLLSFGGISWKRVCVLRDNMGQVQGLLLSFCLPFIFIKNPNQNRGYSNLPPFPPPPSSADSTHVSSKVASRLKL